MENLDQLLLDAALSLDNSLAQIDPDCQTTDSETVRAAHDGIASAQHLCHLLAKSSGWWDEFEQLPENMKPLWIGTKVALIHSEASEALEGFRKNLHDDHLKHRRMAEVELADVIIRTLDLAGGLGLDVASAMIEKLAYNQNRADHKRENRAAEGGKTF